MLFNCLDIKNMENRLINMFVKKVLIIFLIGLVCRVGLNLVYDIGVFKEFYDYISLVCYGFMICSSVVVYELPSININAFKVKFIKEAIVEWCENGVNKDKFVVGDTSDTSNSKNIVNSKNTKDRLKEYNLLHRNSSGVYKGSGSAAVSGLYGRSVSGRVPAGIAGLYGESSISSSRPSTGRRDLNVDRECMDERIRNRIIRKRSGNDSNDVVRVSGFNKKAPVECVEVREIYSNGEYHHKDNISRILSSNRSLNVELIV